MSTPKAFLKWQMSAGDFIVSSARFVAPPPSWGESVMTARRVPFANVVNGALRLYGWTELK